jgi:hypothetical protein
MRLLLAVTPGITNLDIRCHEGTAAPGWDGSATSAGSVYLPAGELRFEFGTGRDPKRKAQADYEKRAAELPRDAESVFVFATPRNWAGARAWASERAAEGGFKGVKAIDAHVLEGWLQASPSVHCWISERLGYRPRGAQTIEGWWGAFRGRLAKPLPTAFFVAGRERDAAETLSVLTNVQQSNGMAVVRASCDDEALAFLYGILCEHEDLLCRTMVIEDERAWRQIVESSVPLILIPLFDGEPDLAAAANGGHRVVTLAGPDDVVRGRAIRLGKVEPVAAREALAEVGHDSENAAALVALGRRSVAALVRRVSKDPRIRKPEWVKDPEQSAVLAPLVLVGSWTDSEGDTQAIKKMVRRSWDHIERLLKSLAKRPDAPFVRSGETWRLTSPTEAALLLMPELTKNDIARWMELTSGVLLEPDPYLGMDAVQRFQTSDAGATPVYSEILKQGLAGGLALAAASDEELPPGLRIRDTVDAIVGRLVDAANADTTGDAWASLAGILPLLAEASPEVFLDAIEFDLDRPNPVLSTMFNDQGTDVLFGPSSPHPHLLWALETLCWSSVYFGRAAFLLGRLAASDPGGRLGNRPIRSLKNVTAGWLAQSGASAEEKIDAIDRILRRDPDVGWEVAMAVWPAGNAITEPPRSPRFREWSSSTESVSFADWSRFVEGLVALAIAAAGTSAERWQELVHKIGSLSPGQQRVVTERLSEVVDQQAWSADERYSVWSSLTSEADRHEEQTYPQFPTDGDEVASFPSIARDLEPIRDPRRFSHLFDWRVRVPSNRRTGDEGYAAELAGLRSDAIDQVLAQGTKALEALVVDVDTPNWVGQLLGQKQAAPEQVVLGWLDSEDPNLRSAAHAFAATKIVAEGIEWLKTALVSPSLERKAPRERIMAAVPFTKEYWMRVATLGGDLEIAYWQCVDPSRVLPEQRREAVLLLLRHERPWDAAGLLCDACDDHEELDIGLVKEVFGGLRQVTAPPRSATLSGYHIERLLEYLEQHAAHDEELPRFEFMFFELLNNHHPTAALYRTLNNSPDEFVNLVEAGYRGERDAKRSLTAEEHTLARRAWGVLRAWPTVPGTGDDGTIDAARLAEWVRSARLSLSDTGRTAVGDEVIGEVLAASPMGADGVWPVEPVREIIESVGSPQIDTGLHIGRTKRRGITWRGVFDGGGQERALEREYREMAGKIAVKWPRTARILRGIADDYRDQAHHHDTEAERRGDGG